MSMISASVTVLLEEREISNCIKYSYVLYHLEEGILLKTLRMTTFIQSTMQMTSANISAIIFQIK